jgi:hypothetical protein
MSYIRRDDMRRTSFRPSSAYEDNLYAVVKPFISVYLAFPLRLLLA